MACVPWLVACRGLAEQPGKEARQTLKPQQKCISLNKNVSPFRANIVPHVIAYWLWFGLCKG